MNLNRAAVENPLLDAAFRRSFPALVENVASTLQGDLGLSLSREINPIFIVL
jgi:hypothetical protein